MGYVRFYLYVRCEIVFVHATPYFCPTIMGEPGRSGHKRIPDSVSHRIRKKK